MNRMNRKYVTLGLLLILAIALVGLPEALAISNYLDAFKTKYGTANTKLDTCDICHVYGSNARNLYGQDVEIQLIGGATTTTLTVGATSTLTIDQALTNTEPKDSDGDTYSNIDEIKALTFPGNTSDYPATVTVTFNITDGHNNIQNAAVSMDSIKMKTDSSGIAVFTDIAPGNHTYAVSKTGYKRLTGVVNAKGNTTVFVKLVLK